MLQACAVVAISATIVSCSSLGPATTANGEAARARCISQVKNMQGLEGRLHQEAAKVRGAERSKGLVALKFTFFELKNPYAKGRTQVAKVITAAEAEQRIKTFERMNKDVVSVNYPRVVSQSSMPVIVNSIVNQPIGKNGKPAVMKIEYVPIGTQIGATATPLKNGKMQMYLDLNLADITGSERYMGKRYPVFSSRTYTGTHQVPEGNVVYFELEPVEGDDSTLAVFATVSMTDDQAHSGEVEVSQAN
ncbi:MAG: hypothetical protein R3F19_26705 [Verrucomicrobiales bacterium]